MIQGTFGKESRGPPLRRLTGVSRSLGARNGGTLPLTHSRALLKREARDMLKGFFRRELAVTAVN